MKLAYTAEGFIDWPMILSYDAPYTIVIDARTRGKTFGLRYQFALDYIRRGKCFGELVRTKEFLTGSDKLQQGYFDKYYAELPDSKVCRDWLLTTMGKQAYIARRPEDSKQRPDWQTFGYFLALNDAEDIKRRSNSFLPTRRFLMDEALIDKTLPGARYRDYLAGEIGAVSSIITSVARERPSMAEADRPRLYLLGNAVDLTCPWLAHFGITDVPSYGFSWHFQKRCLLWYGPPDEDWARAQDMSVSGGLVADSSLAHSSNLNTFDTLPDEFFGVPSKAATFAFGIVYKRMKYGVWCDMQEGYYYVMPTFPKSTDNKPIYALMADDARPNYILARRAQKSLKGIVELYYCGVIRYKDAITRDGFLEALRLFGIR